MDLNGSLEVDDIGSLHQAVVAGRVAQNGQTLGQRV